MRVTNSWSMTFLMDDSHRALAARPLRWFYLAAALLSGAQPLAAQPASGRVHARVVHDGVPVAGAVITAAARTWTTGVEGAITLELAPGPVRLEITAPGLEAEAAEVTVPAGGEVRVLVELRAPLELEEEVIVSATRSGKRLQDQAVRVEVLEREEIEEKLLMTPGDVAMLLNETSGLRVQVAAPSLGAANVRVQGLRGRYTQILADGLPLYGGQTGSIGLLQIPPMDLGQVEIIKGAASAFYGASALGGVVNLVSRRPPDQEQERELLLN
ncbi:MAG TPA: TonB-dependent receptor, partial [Vicinamibacteria bacterium]|nr:TonB-dependent receptor [Vicinamibacteria bacterium]